MRVLSCLVVCALFLAACASAEKTIKYGYLPGSDYQFYEPLRPVDLKGKRVNLRVVDTRNGNKISCVGRNLPRNTELEGSTGYDYFTGYLRAMIEQNRGVVDPDSKDILEVKLTGLSGDLIGAINATVWGYVEFQTGYKGQNKTYCSAMQDGEPDAPAGKMSIDTRKGAFRKMVSGSTRRALEQLMHDLARM